MNNQYTQAIKALKEFGFNEAPSLEQIEKALTPTQKKQIKDATLVIVPPLSLKELISKFNEKQEIKTWLWNDLWDRYDFGSNWSVSFLLPELKYINQTVTQQRKSLEQESKSIKGLTSIDPRTYIMAQAILRESGQLMDESTWCRFIDEKEETIGGDAVVPDALVLGRGRLLLRGSGVGYAWGGNGVRRVVRVTLDFDSLSLLEPLSSELPDELTINGKVYRAV
jgi:hypothetical protein